MSKYSEVFEAAQKELREAEEYLANARKPGDIDRAFDRFQRARSRVNQLALLVRMGPHKPKKAKKPVPRSKYQGVQ